MSSSHGTMLWRGCWHVPCVRCFDCLPSLTYCCNVGFEGVETLCHALRGSTSLTHLDLSKNDLGSQGAAALLPLLQTKGKLTGLMLSSNGISAHHVAIIRLALRSDCSVVTAY